MLKEIIANVLEGKRITFDEAYWLYLRGSLFDLGNLANYIREKKHPEKNCHICC